ncbi:class I SAM-dependent RNA methyltransferase [Tropicimonas sp. IMCC6043]|uniref:THUMP domain-containing class I SAM-dependent RNA methyltransferase n=1 Tax=Tropicimonas sp. IMCC6043 TaxID=2510645 RepID=UPI00101CD18D|nr:class I SAM-dependent RNA methyltransferase [Tropicimonas sp. IMCC6043]RYH11574.1 class I SAM-dependent RNA methyltransferase [Tropicimonas sp. IMCC6043]
MSEPFEIFLVATPGLEAPLRAEARALGFSAAEVVPGGVVFAGGWPEVWRANLELRGATRVLARIGSFRAFHLAQLDKRARKFPWSTVITPGEAVRVEVTCRKSKIYHAGAAAQRVERAMREEARAVISPDAPLRLMVRIEDDLVTISIDSTGESLHKRGHKEWVGKAPMRETMAAMFLRDCGYDGSEPLLDPMCGSGTFVIEAAEMAAGFQPGRSRSFAFEALQSFDATAFAAMKAAGTVRVPDRHFFGSDRDDGAIRGASANATRAGVGDFCAFQRAAVSEIARPDGPSGLVIVNPPYGARIGNKGPLFGLYSALGTALKERFSGWRVGIVTSDAALAKATGLPLKPPGPVVAHGGLKIRLWQAGPL